MAPCTAGLLQLQFFENMNILLTNLCPPRYISQLSIVYVIYNNSDRFVMDAAYSQACHRFGTTTSSYHALVTARVVGIFRNSDMNYSRLSGGAMRHVLWRLLNQLIVHSIYAVENSLRLWRHVGRRIKR